MPAFSLPTPSPPPSFLPLALPPFLLHSRWFLEVQNIFYQGNKRKQIPLGQLEAFFNATATLMTNLLQELALNSITDYLHVFCCTPVWHVLVRFSVGQECMMPSQKSDIIVRCCA